MNDLIAETNLQAPANPRRVQSAAALKAQQAALVARDQGLNAQKAALESQITVVRSDINGVRLQEARNANGRRQPNNVASLKAAPNAIVMVNTPGYAPKRRPYELDLAA